MKKQFLILAIFFSFYGFSQDCPCVKTAILGENSEASFVHNNKVVAMDDAEIGEGDFIELRTKESMGKVIWYSNGQELGSSIVRPEKTTEYTVKSSLHDCPDAYDKVIISVKTNDFQKGKVFIFPNPVKEILTITSDSGIRNVEVKNITGETLLNLSYTDLSSKQSIDISTLPTGIYLVKIDLPDGNSILKEVIKR
ncbi:MAG: T9SS type A sorting domain-containing protein [Prevotellaceae bacterium]|jgi:hypothetical protein|nr:T9SS type A sorting domain-containing protein [Prevotellaceae bacterium]